eukprot:CAMPEP_0184371538 /NCGR_PEP_ID=MMETSP1089-20130417/163456_1 /TAXON_ID=38269 ORGANISM="Gloeochaete wittrockiana, Strain SAG46.84" /NCGR_SAMPLE_ID=MMETSP1089 /ASSEMBLY_ACC=CAM_ASM_000445 /LENGTH=1023 /DNA_ID=CAMNT_0026714309 /DNA_START=107 /DNA_END=3179 /DNA_ORIENTATION=-
MLQACRNARHFRKTLVRNQFQRPSDLKTDLFGRRVEWFPEHRFVFHSIQRNYATVRASSDGVDGKVAKVERVSLADLGEEMSKSYRDVEVIPGDAMSVIVGRALPDVRDGLKPVHRRVLYAMHELSLSTDSPYRKCARVVGEVLGKFHPHGDTSVYDALVRMAQDFSMLHPLIDGHGNFGSVDDDPPAAMRYTECRLQSFAQETLLKEVDMGTVDWTDNFDGSRKEPTVLPARVPQLLLNGSSGIAVGMATNIPPHNLSEVINAVLALIENPTLEDSLLMKVLPAPDFPTGGIILGTEGCRDAYSSGHGAVVLRGRTHFEKVRSGPSARDAIIITELPYQTNKAQLIQKIADLVNSKKLVGVSDIRDESDRDGMRVVIELKRDAQGSVVLNNLFQHTALQSRFSCNMVAIVDRRPHVLTLRQFLTYFIDFRVETLTRRTQHHLRIAQDRFHLLEGFRRALEDLDGVVSTIRIANSTAEARTALCEKFSMSEAQANGVLNMQLRRLTSMEAQSVQKEHDTLHQQIEELQSVLSSRENVLTLIKAELVEIKAKFGRPRRTQIMEIGTNGEVSASEGAGGEGHGASSLIQNASSLVLTTARGYIKRIPANEFQSQNRGSRGKAGTSIKGDDVVSQFCSCNDHDTVLFFTDRGQAYAVKAYAIPTSARTSRGVSIANVIPIAQTDKVTSVLAVSSFASDRHLIMATRRGLIKKTKLAAYSKLQRKGALGIRLSNEDAVINVALASDADLCIIGTSAGIGVHFGLNGDSLRPMSRGSRGNIAIRLRDGDEVIAMDIVPGAGVPIVPASTPSPTPLLDEEGDVEEENQEGEEEELLEEVDIEAEAEDMEGDAEVDDGEVDTAEDDLGERYWMLLATSTGEGNRVSLSKFPIRRRSSTSRGKLLIKLNKSKRAKLVALKIVGPQDEVVFVTRKGIINRQRVKHIPVRLPRRVGLVLQKLDDKDEIVAVALVPAIERSDSAIDNNDKDGIAIEDSDHISTTPSPPAPSFSPSPSPAVPYFPSFSVPSGPPL